MKIGLYTLGCKVNQYETQAMEQLLREMGHSVGDFREDCDGYIVNTCSVTAVADKKNRNVIRRCRREHPEAVLGVCGCYGQQVGELLRSLGVDVIGGSSLRKEFLQAVVDAVEKRQTARVLDEALKRRTFETLPAGGLEGRTRAMLKVQDGCVNFCSYCIIPYLRGPVRSASIEQAVESARALEKQGYQEIVITGIEIASWGADLPEKPGFARLLRAVCEAVPEVRIRLSSLEPRLITEAFCREIKALPNLCPHFHLSLQSGSDAVLKRMNRKYDTARYLQSVALLREYFPGCAVTTDLIVAFPGETEEEFGESLAFMEKCAFADMHIFPYSRRPGTPAAKMPGQHPNEVKERRSAMAIAAAQKMNEAYRKEMVGTLQPVLFEESEKGYYVGHAPNSVKVYVKAEDLHNKIRNAAVTELTRDGVKGELV